MIKSTETYGDEWIRIYQFYILQILSIPIVIFEFTVLTEMNEFEFTSSMFYKYEIMLVYLFIS